MKKILIGILLLAIYLISCIPVGLFLYSLKSEMGYNVFSKTGFHTYLHCLQEQAYKIELHEKREHLATPESLETK